MPEPRILDVVNTDHAALNFLANRVAWVNRNSEFRNDIVCSTGPHLTHVPPCGATVTAMPIPRGLAPRPLGAFLAELVRHLRGQRYAIVHTHNSVTGAVGRIAACMARVPLTIHTTHGFHFDEHMGRVRRWPFVAAERWLARRSDLLLCQNEQEFAHVQKLGFRPRLGIHHVGNGIDLRRFRPRRTVPKNARPVVLAVGRLEPVKNHPMLFRALALLGRRAPTVWVVGDGPCRDRYEALVRDMGLGDVVQFLGYRYDIPRLTAAADVAVLTSVKEGMPRALMQAMAVGVPVVATAVRGTREVVRDGETGFLVPLDDAPLLAERLGRLLETPALRREMGAHGVAHARAHFDEERVVARLVDLYRGGLRRRGFPLGGASTERVEQVGQA